MRIRSWSADSQRVYFKASRRDGGKDEIASVAVGTEEPDLQVHYNGKLNTSSFVSCSPDGTRLVIGVVGGNPPRMLVHEIDPRKNDAPVLLKGSNT